jgi:O-antigen ligase
MKQVSYFSVFHYSIFLFSFLFSFLPNTIGLLAVILFLVILVGHVKKHIQFQFNSSNLFLIGLYFSYLIGIFFTNNPDIAASYAENKLSFFIFPLLFSIKTTHEINVKFWINGLISGISVAIVLGLVNAVQCFEENASLLNCFTSSTISPIHHPSYFSLFILITLFAMYHFGYFQQRGIKAVIIYMFSSIAFIYFLACLSLSVVLFLFLFLAFVLMRYIYKKYTKIYFYISIVIVPVLIYFTLSKTPIFKDEFNYAKTSLNQYFYHYDDFLKAKNNYATGNETRLIMWTVAFEVIKENPFGVGTGNVDDFLRAKLLNHGLNNIAEKNYNPHNQFLQTTVEIGILGLIVFLSFLFFAVKSAIQYKNYLLLFILAGFIFNSLFESMFQRQSGIVFFSFAITFLGFYQVTHKDSSNNINLKD